MKETIVKINKTKNCFLEEIKLTNLQPDQSRKKREESNNIIRNEKGEVITDKAGIQKIMRLL